ncbi:MAG TPA: hypothetical protein VGQ83_16560 [Polyangia bacterium]|jgi:hypothetical protein
MSARRVLLLVVFVLAAASAIAAGLAGIGRGRDALARAAEERQLQAARGAATAASLYLDGILAALRAAASEQESGAARDPAATLEAVYGASEQLRLVTFTDENGGVVGDPVLQGDPAAHPRRQGHPPAARDEVAAHLAAIPRIAALRFGWAVGEPFMRGGRGPFVVIALAFKARGADHAPGRPCRAGAPHFVAAELTLDYLVAQLRIAGLRDTLIVDGRGRILAGGPPLAEAGPLGERQAAAGITLHLTDPERGPVLAAVSPVPRYGWSVLVRAPAGAGGGPLAPGARGHAAWLVASGLAALAAGLALARRRSG